MIIIRWIINAAILLGIAYWLPGIEVSGFYIALITALILGLVNIVIKPILLILTLPINILTLGLFTFFINGFLFYFVASFVEGFSVVDYSAAFFGALVMTVVGWIVNAILKD